MAVPTRYILAALAFGVAALGLFLLPTDAAAECNGPCVRQPPSCNQGCNTPAPPPASPRPQCCQSPVLVVPPPYVPPPNIVVVNSAAHAAAQASSIAIAVANVQTGDTIIRSNTVVDGGAAAVAGVQFGAFTVTEASASVERVARDRDLLVQAICMDASGNPHPASQTFGGRDVAEAYRGEIYRCMSGTRMRYTIDGQTADCAAGQALWYEGAQVSCRTQIARRPCNERSLLRRFGPGDKMVRIRDTQVREAHTETTFNGAMTMDGGVGQSVW